MEDTISHILIGMQKLKQENAMSVFNASHFYSFSFLIDGSFYVHFTVAFEMIKMYYVH